MIGMKIRDKASITMLQKAKRVRKTVDIKVRTKDIDSQGVADSGYSLSPGETYSITSDGGLFTGAGYSDSTVTFVMASRGDQIGIVKQPAYGMSAEQKNTLSRITTAFGVTVSDFEMNKSDRDGKTVVDGLAGIREALEKAFDDSKEDTPQSGLDKLEKSIKVVDKGVKVEDVKAGGTYVLEKDGEISPYPISGYGLEMVENWSDIVFEGSQAEYSMGVSLDQKQVMDKLEELGFKIRLELWDNELEAEW